MSGSAAQAEKTYYIDEATDYTGNGCENADLNTVTASLETALDNEGWTGSRYVNSLAYPQDFYEACSSNYGNWGADDSFGDTGTLAVFAGHGGQDYLMFGSANESRCGVTLSSNMRLGTMAGSNAAFGMWLACEVIKGATMGTNMHQHLRQQAGWQNSIAIGDHEPRDFYNATHLAANSDAWLNQMSSGGRDAIIATFSTYSGSDCWYVHDRAKLRGNVYNAPRSGGPTCNQGQAHYYYCYETRKN